MYLCFEFTCALGLYMYVHINSKLPAVACTEGHQATRLLLTSLLCCCFNSYSSSAQRPLTGTMDRYVFEDFIEGSTAFVAFQTTGNEFKVALLAASCMASKRLR